MEEWKDVSGFEGSYQVSNLGRVRSLTRLVNRKGNIKRELKGQILKGDINKYGYVNYRLWKDNKLKNITGHRLVCIAFLDNPENKKEVNHKNGIPDDNRLDNLEWCTRSENTLHAIKTKLQRGKIPPISEDDFNEIERRKALGEKLVDLFLEFNAPKHSFYYRRKYGYMFDKNRYIKD
jgi:hypothetical protein